MAFSLPCIAFDSSFSRNSTLCSKPIASTHSLTSTQHAALSLTPFHLLRLPLRSAPIVCRLPGSPRAALTDNEPGLSSLTPSRNLPLLDIPGTYGPPLLGAAHDKLNYFLFQGRDEFFLSLMKRYGSTVIRLNMPPGPPFFPDSRTIMLLDQKSIPVVFDTSRVEKRDVFAGTYMPSTDFTGGFRVLPYLDPSEEKHGLLKGFCFEILRSNGRKWFPEFHTAFEEAAVEWETQLAKGGRADFASVTQNFTLNFLCRTILNTDPAYPGEASLGKEGPSLIQAWIGLQLAPQTSLGLPKPVELVLLHTFPLPFALVSRQYETVYKFFRANGEEVLNMGAEKFGLDREEACHNLLFFVCFNTWGGLQLFLPTIINRVASAGLPLQKELAAEVRDMVKIHGSLNMRSLASMELLHSVVYEVLRMDPPVPFQYGRAKHDLIVESHDALYSVKKGELLGAYQKIAMRDPRVFARPDSFEPKRFMGHDGKALLQNLTWSNGPETEEPTLANKQCAGKDFVNLVARLLLAELFLRYDFFRVDQEQEKVSFTTLKKRSPPP